MDRKVVNYQGDRNGTVIGLRPGWRGHCISSAQPENSIIGHPVYHLHSFPGPVESTKQLDNAGAKYFLRRIAEVHGSQTSQRR